MPKRFSVLGLVVPALLVLCTGSSALAAEALVWPKWNIEKLKADLKEGVCSQKKLSLLRQDVCTTYGFPNYKKASRPLGKVSIFSDSMLHLESNGQLIKLERGTAPALFLVNSSMIDTRKVKTRAELRALIEKALPKRTASLWMTPAYAEALNPQVPALLQIFIEETVQAGSCDLYLNFATKCVEGLRFVYEEVRRKTVEVQKNETATGLKKALDKSGLMTQVQTVNTDLATIIEQFSGAGFPALESNRSLEICAEKNFVSPKQVKEERDRLQLCYDMQVRLKDYTQAIVTAEKPESQSALDFIAGITTNPPPGHPFTRTPVGTENPIPSLDTQAVK